MHNPMACDDPAHFHCISAAIRSRHGMVPSDIECAMAANTSHDPEEESTYRFDARCWRCDRPESEHQDGLCLRQPTVLYSGHRQLTHLEDVDEFGYGCD